MKKYKKLNTNNMNPIFFDCNGNDIFEHDMYYVVTAHNTIKTFIASTAVPEEDETLCFKLFKDARDTAIKFKMEAIVDLLKDEMMNCIFSHETGLPDIIQKHINSLNILSRRLRDAVSSSSLEISE